MRPSLRLLALALELSACERTTPTPSGTVLVEASPTKLSVSPWSVGTPVDAGTRIATTYLYTPTDLGDPVRFELSFVHGALAFVDPTPRPDAPKTILAPRELKITVVENNAWAMSGACEEELSVPLAVNEDGTSAVPTSVWARCRVDMERRSGSISVAAWLEVHGDGRVDAGPNEDLRIVTQ